MRFALIAVIAIVLSGCRPDPPMTDRATERVYPVGARDLFNSYADSSERWTGQKIKTALKAGQYRSQDGRTYWCSERPTLPSIIWNVASPEAKNISITGVCRGRVRDQGSWHVAVTECSVEVTEP